MRQTSLLTAFIAKPLLLHQQNINTPIHQLSAFFNKMSKPADPSSSSSSFNDDLDLSSIEKFAHKKGDALFGYLEQCQLESSTPSFGRFLDAGTGTHSLRWMASIIHRERLLANTDINGESSAPDISMKSYVAITADETMRKNVYKQAKELGIENQGSVIIGNWKTGIKVDEENGGIEFDDSGDALLEGEQFDTILADYLVGAIDGFSPYFQDQIFHRLVKHLAPGGRLYIIGLQPIPDSVDGDANVFCKITKVRDACIKLADHRCYREYPLDWIERHVKRAGLQVVESKKYPIRYDFSTMLRQINVGRSKLKLFPTKGLGKEMGSVLDGLEEECREVTNRQKDGRITLGFDYVVVAERTK